MADLKNMTVQALRDLARKALGRGQSTLKTKRELVEALEAAGAAPGVSGAKPPMSKTAKPAAGFAPKAQPPAKPGSKAKPAGSGAKPRRSGGIGGGAPDVKVGAAGAPLAKRARAPKAQAAAQPPAPVRRAVATGTEPDPEGYMVARVAGEEALRGAPHPMTESALDFARKAPPLRPPEVAAGLDEVLGDLPWSYGDDVLVALPRDPTTLFLYWDHAPETLRQAWAGLDGGRPQLRVSVRESGGEWANARTIDFALESRSYYVHDLTPGRVYRAEIHIVGRTGRDEVLARPSNEIQLPPTGPSPVVDDRFMVLPWSEPLQRLLREAHAGGPFSEDLRAQLARLSDWSRFAGRAWGGWGESAGGMGGRPFSPASSPSSPAGAWGRPDGKGQ